MSNQSDIPHMTPSGQQSGGNVTENLVFLVIVIVVFVIVAYMIYREERG